MFYHSILSWYISLGERLFDAVSFTLVINNLVAGWIVSFSDDFSSLLALFFYIIILELQSEFLVTFSVCVRFIGIYLYNFDVRTGSHWSYQACLSFLLCGFCI